MDTITFKKWMNLQFTEESLSLTNLMALLPYSRGVQGGSKVNILWTTRVQTDIISPDYIIKISQGTLTFVESGKNGTEVKTLLQNFLENNKQIKSVEVNNNKAVSNNLSNEENKNATNIRLGQVLTEEEKIKRTLSNAIKEKRSRFI